MDEGSPLRIVVNGKSAADPRLVDAVAGLRATGQRVEVRPSWEGSDIVRLTREALDDAAAGRIGTIVAAGGDGTVSEVFGTAFAEGLPERTALGLLPLGTANDFARAAGLPLEDITACLNIAASGPAAAIDVGLVDGRPFINLLSGGFGSRVTVETDPELKRRLGSMAYLLTGLARLGDLAVSAGRFTGDGFEWEGSFIAAAIGNGRYAGGGLPLCPDALADDGLLDIMVLPELLQAVAEASPIGLFADDPAEAAGLQRTARSSWFEYASDAPLHVNLDGEPAQLKSFRVECRPAALPVRLGNSPLLRSYRPG
jgi:lipid kinase YegS